MLFYHQAISFSTGGRAVGLMLCGWKGNRPAGKWQHLLLGLYLWQLRS